MLREWSWWGLSLVCAFLVWVSIVIAGIIASLLPEAWRLLPAVFPVAVVVLIGLGAADHWWTWGALLSAAPLLAFGVYSLVEALRSTEDTRYHSYAVGFAIAGLGYGLALAVVAVALAALGVIIGQRRNPRGRDVTDLVEDAWAPPQGKPACDNARRDRCRHAPAPVPGDDHDSQDIDRRNLCA